MNEPIFQNVLDLIGVICVLFLVISVLVGLFVCACVYYAKQCRQEKEFIESLDEHDRSVILNYKTSKQVIFKHGERKK